MKISKKLFLVAAIFACQISTSAFPAESSDEAAAPAETEKLVQPELQFYVDGTTITMVLTGEQAGSCAMLEGEMDFLEHSGGGGKDDEQKLKPGTPVLQIVVKKDAKDSGDLWLEKKPLQDINGFSEKPLIGFDGNIDPNVVRIVRCSHDLICQRTIDRLPPHQYSATIFILEVGNFLNYLGCEPAQEACLRLTRPIVEAFSTEEKKALFLSDLCQSPFACNVRTTTFPPYPELSFREIILQQLMDQHAQREFYQRADDYHKRFLGMVKIVFKNNALQELRFRELANEIDPEIKKSLDIPIKDLKNHVRESLEESIEMQERFRQKYGDDWPYFVGAD
jgi:hypothetical protein